MRDGIIPAEKINLPADIARLYAGNRRVDGAASGERAAYDGVVFPADHTLLHGFAEQGGGGEDTATALLLTETIKYALIVIASFPMLCLYPFMQRFFVKGVMLGAVKG